MTLLHLNTQVKLLRPCRNQTFPFTGQWWPFGKTCTEGANSENFTQPCSDFSPSNKNLWIWYKREKPQACSSQPILINVHQIPTALGTNYLTFPNKAPEGTGALGGCLSFLTDAHAGEGQGCRGIRLFSKSPQKIGLLHFFSWEVVKQSNSLLYRS